MIFLLQAYNAFMKGKIKLGRALNKQALTLSMINIFVGSLGHFVGWLLVVLYFPYFAECGLLQPGPQANTALCQSERTILF